MEEQLNQHERSIKCLPRKFAIAITQDRK